MTGLAARTHSRYGGTSSMAADSGPAIAMFFGTISPSSTCSTTTMVIAMTNDTVQHRVGHAEQVKRQLQQVRHRGFAHPAQRDRTDRDAELCPGQHQRKI